MHKYNYSFMLISFLVVAAVAYGFSLTGSPLAQKRKSQDATRISSITSLKYPIERFFEKNKSLPESLDQLVPDQIALLPTDPETKKSFDYKVDTSSSYSICTTFATDTKNFTNTELSPAYSESTSSTKHVKGYDCIKYVLPTRITNPYTSPTPRSTSASQITVFGTVDSIAESTTNPRIIVSDNKIMKIFSLNNTQIIDKNGKETVLSSFQSGDKVIVDGNPISGNYSNFSATRLQNLSR